MSDKVAESLPKVLPRIILRDQIMPPATPRMGTMLSAHQATDRLRAAAWPGGGDIVFQIQTALQRLLLHAGVLALIFTFEVYGSLIRPNSSPAVSVQKK